MGLIKEMEHTAEVIGENNSSSNSVSLSFLALPFLFHFSVFI